MAIILWLAYLRRTSRGAVGSAQGRVRRDDMAARLVNFDPASKFPAELALMIKLNVWLVRAKLAAAAMFLALAGLIVLVRGIARLPG